MPTSKKSKPPQRCKTDGCVNQPAPGSKHCPLCHITVGFNRQVDKANRRGDTLGALLHTVLAFGTNALRESQAARPAAPPIFQRRPGHPRQERPPGHGQQDPFQVLGLDPVTATEDDVKRIQRGAAQMWHEDRGQKNPQAQARLAEINAAAVTCIQSIRDRVKATG